MEKPMKDPASLIEEPAGTAFANWILKVFAGAGLGNGGACSKIGL